ncbi:MAG: DUF502 domain-containing protein [Haloarculaceae archaeon]
MSLLTAAEGTVSDAGRVRDRLRRAMIEGAAITIPFVVTVIVLGLVVNFVSQALDPVVGVVDTTVGSGSPSDLTLKLVALGGLVATTLLVGLAAEERPGQGSFESSFDRLMSRIPGVGSLYRSFDEMSDLLLDSDTDSFQEVKLVEFPESGSYTVAFLTAETPETVREATGHDGMVTLFLPMAPNPVMGGYVLHVSEDRVIDVDMSVQEGIRSIVTSGVATDSAGDHSLSADELAALTTDPLVEQVVTSDSDGETDDASATDDTVGHGGATGDGRDPGTDTGKYDGADPSE